MKLMDIKKEYEKENGIYRIYIKYNNKEVSYIGRSKNINDRLKFHRREIKRTIIDGVLFSNRKISECPRVKELNQNYSIPATGAFYYKVYLMQKILKEKDYQKFLKLINYEVLKTFDTDRSVFEIEKTEIGFMKSYDSIWRGFNGYNAIYFKYLYVPLAGSGKTDLIEREALTKMDKEMQNEFDRRTDDPFLWIYFNKGQNDKYEKEMNLLFPELNKNYINHKNTWTNELIKLNKISTFNKIYTEKENKENINEKIKTRNQSNKFLHLIRKIFKKNH